jgi:hypothetical protein
MSGYPGKMIYQCAVPTANLLIGQLKENRKRSNIVGSDLKCRECDRKAKYLINAQVSNPYVLHKQGMISAEISVVRLTNSGR